MGGLATWEVERHCEWRDSGGLGGWRVTLEPWKHEHLHSGGLFWGLHMAPVTNPNQEMIKLKKRSKIRNKLVIHTSNPVTSQILLHGWVDGGDSMLISAHERKKERLIIVKKRRSILIFLNRERDTKGIIRVSLEDLLEMFPPSSRLPLWVLFIGLCLLKAQMHRNHYICINQLPLHLLLLVKP